MVFALDAILDPVSLFEPVFHDGRGHGMCDGRWETKNTDENWLARIALRRSDRQPGEREKRIIRLRFSRAAPRWRWRRIHISQAQVSRLEGSARH